MITIKDFMEIVQYRISDTDDFLWNCYGTESMSMDSWDKENDSYTISIVFDKVNQTVYEMQASDYKNNRSYRWIDPAYKDRYFDEANTRGVDPNEAWDDIKYTDLETVDDILDKARAIFNGVDYDTRVSVPIDIDDEELFHLMKMAHQEDITLNQYIEKVLKRYIDDINHE